MSQPDSNQEPELIDLYQKPDKIYPRSFSGRYRTLRMVGGTVLICFFLAPAG